MIPSQGHRVVIGSISGRAWSYVIELYNEDPTLFLDEVAGLVLAAFGELIPISTLCQNLRRHNFTRRVFKQLSIKRQLEDEKTWAEMVSRTPASYFVFIDYTFFAQELSGSCSDGTAWANGAPARPWISNGRGGSSIPSLQPFRPRASAVTAGRGASWTLASRRGAPMGTCCAP